MKLGVYVDDFQLIPSIWRLKTPFSGNQARYFGHTWAICWSWLWWEIEVHGDPKNNQTQEKA
jgi:hypothetical protein